MLSDNENNRLNLSVVKEKEKKTLIVDVTLTIRVSPQGYLAGMWLPPEGISWTNSVTLSMNHLHTKHTNT